MNGVIKIKTDKGFGFISREWEEKDVISTFQVQQTRHLDQAQEYSE